MASGRYSKYEVVDEEGNKIELRIRKWSMVKCLAILRDVGEIVKELGDNFNIQDGNLTAPQVAQLLVQLGDNAVQKCTRILKESIQSPRLNEDQIMEWCLEDYVGVLAKVIETNLTEGLAKNFGSLKSATLDRMPQNIAGNSQRKSQEPSQTSSSNQGFVPIVPGDLAENLRTEN